jgi:hypothetical protein
MSYVLTPAGEERAKAAAERMKAAAIPWDRATPRVPNVKMPLEPVVNLLALGGVVYVATTSNVYRVEGDELVRLKWPRGPQRRRKGGG